MAFFYDQLRNIFDLENGHSVVLDQHNDESLLIKLASNGFDHTFLLLNNYKLGNTKINPADFTLDRYKKGDFIVGVVSDTTNADNDLAKLLFHYHKDTSINILKNITNPTPYIATEKVCKSLVMRFAPHAIYACEIQKRQD